MGKNILMKKSILLVFCLASVSFDYLSPLSFSWKKKDATKNESKLSIDQQVSSAKKMRDQTIYSNNVESLLVELEDSFDRGNHVDEQFPLIQKIIKSLEKYDQDSIFVYFRNLKNKLQRTKKVQASSVAILLKSLSDLWIYKFEGQSVSGVRKNINLEESLLDAFLIGFSSFKANPDYFLKNLAEDLEKKIYQPDDSITLKNVSEQLVGIVSTLLSKLTWNSTNVDSIWVEFLEVANCILEFGKIKAVPTLDEVNDFYAILVSRFGLFLEINALGLPVYFYDECLMSISSGEADFFTTIKDIEKVGKDSREILLESLTVSKAKLLSLKKNDASKKMNKF